MTTPHAYASGEPDTTYSRAYDALPAYRQLFSRLVARRARTTARADLRNLGARELRIGAHRIRGTNGSENIGER